MANPMEFISQVRSEVGRISWPTRREVITTTIMVGIMSALFALFFLLIDITIRFGLNQVLNAFG